MGMDTAAGGLAPLVVRISRFTGLPVQVGYDVLAHTSGKSSWWVRIGGEVEQHADDPVIAMHAAVDAHRSDLVATIRRSAFRLLDTSPTSSE